MYRDIDNDFELSNLMKLWLDLHKLLYIITIQRVYT